MDLIEQERAIRSAIMFSITIEQVEKVALKYFPGYSVDKVLHYITSSQKRMPDSKLKVLVSKNRDNIIRELGCNYKLVILSYLKNYYLPKLRSSYTVRRKLRKGVIRVRRNRFNSVV